MSKIDTKIIDKLLTDKLLKKLDKLRKKIDWIADKKVRQELDEHATVMYNIIIKHSEEKQSKNE